jgi:hypothetical protein
MNGVTQASRVVGRFAPPCSKANLAGFRSETRPERGAATRREPLEPRAIALPKHRSKRVRMAEIAVRFPTARERGSFFVARGSTCPPIGGNLLGWLVQDESTFPARRGRRFEK